MKELHRNFDGLKRRVLAQLDADGRMLNSGWFISELKRISSEFIKKSDMAVNFKSHDKHDKIEENLEEFKKEKERKKIEFEKEGKLKEDEKAKKIIYNAARTYYDYINKKLKFFKELKTFLDTTGEGGRLVSKTPEQALRSDFLLESYFHLEIKEILEQIKSQFSEKFRSEIFALEKPACEQDHNFNIEKYKNYWVESEHSAEEVKKELGDYTFKVFSEKSMKEFTQSATKAISDFDKAMKLFSAEIKSYEKKAKEDALKRKKEQKAQIRESQDAELQKSKQQNATLLEQIQNYWDKGLYDICETCLKDLKNIPRDIVLKSLHQAAFQN